MNRSRVIPIALCCGLLCAVSPSALADTWNKKTVVSLPEKVEIPGAVLDPGKYVFKLADSNANRHIVQVMNEDENHVYATILAIPNYRLEPADKTVITFYEMPGGRPQALRAWFYPGDNFGQEFAYPKTRAVEIAQSTKLNVPSVPEPESREAGSKVEMASAAPPPAAASPPSTDAAANPAPAAQPEAPASEAAANNASKMPDTASDLPLVGLLGLLSLAAAITLRIAAKRLA